MTKRDGEKSGSLSVESLMEAAYRKTGLTDWGGEEFKVPLQVMLNSFEKDNEPDRVMELTFKKYCIELLGNRLQIQEVLTSSPEILQVPIKRPLFIVGLPRSGTTLLHNLLGQAQGCRVLALWEMLKPVPPPDKATRSTDPRIEKAKLIIDPKIKHIHEIRADGPEECQYLMRNTLMNQSHSFWRLPTYVDWLFKKDMTQAYQYYKKMLQILLWKCPGEYLVLKDPLHLEYLEALFKTFPDANLVWIHRDPGKTIPSYCSLESAINEGLPVEEHKRNVDYFEYVVNYAMQVRDRGCDSHFYDLQYKDLMKDPIGSIRRIHEHFHYPYDDCMDENIMKWLNEYPKNKHGSHKYTMSQFGLSEDEIKVKFSPYCKRYNILPE